MIVTGFVAGYTREEGERKGACWGWRRLNQALCLHLLWFIPISLSPAVALGGSEFAVQCCATFPSWLLRLKYQLQPIGTPANVGKEFNVPIMWKLGHNTEQCMTAELFLALQPVIKRIQSSKQSFHGYLATKQVSHYYLESGAKSRHVLMESPSTPSCVHSHSILSASSPLTWFLSQTLMLAVFLLTCLLWLFIQTCKWTCLKKNASAQRSNSCPAISDLGMANMSYCQGQPWDLQHILPAVQVPPFSSEGDRNRQDPR